MDGSINNIYTIAITFYQIIFMYYKRFLKQPVGWNGLFCIIGKVRDAVITACLKRVCYHLNNKNHPYNTQVIDLLLYDGYLITVSFY